MKNIKDLCYGTIPFLIDPASNQPQYLLIHHQKGHWDFTKGHKEGDESDIQTALRETIEETQLEIKKLFEKPQFFEKYTFSQPSGETIDKTVTFFLAEAANNKIVVQPEEVIEYAWLGYEEASEKITFKAGKEVLKEAHQYLLTILD